MKKSILSLILLMTSTFGWSQFFHKSNIKYNLRAGYSIGGTTPMDMPASIRHLNEYRLTPNFQIGAEALKKYNEDWSILVGLLLENKGMKEDVNVKNYDMTVIYGGQALTGMFTGDVTTNVRQWMFTVPIQLTYHLNSDWQFRAGPHASYVFSKSFKGYAHNGYLREGDPTGAKINFGEAEEEQGNYDFSQELRDFQWGIGIGTDWRCYQKLALSADFNLGLSGIHNGSFKTIKQRLYPIYVSFGLKYQVN